MGRKQHPGRQQHALCSGLAGQHFGVLVQGVYPGKHAGQRLLVHHQAHVLHQLQAAVAGFIEPLAQALYVFAVVAVRQDAVHHALAQFGAGQAAEQLGVRQRLNPRGRCRDIAHAQAARQSFGKTTDQEHAAQAVQGGQPRGLDHKVGIGVVFQDQKIVLLGQTQQVIRHRQRQAKPRGVVHHRVGNKQLGLVRLGQLLQGLNIGPVAQARHGHHPHPQRAQQAKYQKPGRVFHQHGIAGAQHAAQHQIHALRDAGHGHQLLLRVHRQTLCQQIRGQLLAQGCVALWGTVAEQLHASAAAHGAHGGVQHVVIHPAGRQHARAAIEMHAIMLAKNAAQQKRRIKSRVGCQAGGLQVFGA